MRRAMRWALGLGTCACLAACGGAQPSNDSGDNDASTAMEAAVDSGGAMDGGATSEDAAVESGAPDGGADAMQEVPCRAVLTGAENVTLPCRAYRSQFDMSFSHTELFIITDVLDQNTVRLNMTVPGRLTAGSSFTSASMGVNWHASFCPQRSMLGMDAPCYTNAGGPMEGTYSLNVSSVGEETALGGGLFHYPIHGTIQVTAVDNNSMAMPKPSVMATVTF